MKLITCQFCIFAFSYLSICSQASAETPISKSASDLKVNQEVIDSSPVLRRWLTNPPDLLDDIYNSPSFDPTLRVGITSRDNNLGVDVGIDNLLVGQTRLAASASYQSEFSGKESGFDANLRYYILPLGSYFNIAPQVGFRQLNVTDRPTISGVDLGLQGILVLSPHSADLRLGQTFTAPGSNVELSITSLSASYALTKQIRLGSKIEWRRSPIFNDSRVGFVLEFNL
ncbi:hypothetical protein V2H45_00180 [Tumidithrix elongata RA019]|uniref:Uncharacterized protein n=1 Tax=Tumidithrix elongata BACA0141 TaxID=2716417 RepID=A0AAW9PUP1_9CYAN|nr:hypothetical protein [Tumidithrix elongata RA019]